MIKQTKFGMLLIILLFLSGCTANPNGSPVREEAATNAKQSQQVEIQSASLRYIEAYEKTNGEYENGKTITILIKEELAEKGFLTDSAYRVPGTDRYYRAIALTKTDGKWNMEQAKTPEIVSDESRAGTSLNNEEVGEENAYVTQLEGGEWKLPYYEMRNF